MELGKRIVVLEKRELILHSKVEKMMESNDIDRIQPLVNLVNVYQEGIRDLMNTKAGYYNTDVSIGFK